MMRISENLFSLATQPRRIEMPPPNPPENKPQYLSKDQMLDQTAAQCAATITAALATRIQGTAPDWNQQLLNLNVSFYDQVRGLLRR
jgi:hypothetical protein